MYMWPSEAHVLLERRQSDEERGWGVSCMAVGKEGRTGASMWVPNLAIRCFLKGDAVSRSNSGAMQSHRFTRLAALILFPGISCVTWDT